MLFSRRADLSSFVLELTPDCSHSCGGCCPASAEAVYGSMAETDPFVKIYSNGALK